jgi:hypothetical protein
LDVVRGEKEGRSKKTSGSQAWEIRWMVVLLIEIGKVKEGWGQIQNSV